MKQTMARPTVLYRAHLLLLTVAVFALAGVSIFDPPLSEATGQAERLRVQSLEIVDEDDNVLVRLGADGMEAGLTLLRSDGKPGAKLVVVDGESPAFGLHGDTSYALFRFHPGSRPRCELEMSSGKRPAVEILAAGDEGVVQLGSGEHRVAVASSKEAGQLRLVAESVVATDRDQQETKKLK